MTNVQGSQRVKPHFSRSVKSVAVRVYLNQLILICLQNV